MCAGSPGSLRGAFKVTGPGGCRAVGVLDLGGFETSEPHNTSSILFALSSLGNSSCRRFLYDQ